jgi:predicted DsbA family dithiol-disulfide isomerase
VRKQFADKADINIHFQPFQLYPDLPGKMDSNINIGGNNDGKDKGDWAREMKDALGASQKAVEDHTKNMKAYWKAEGLELSYGEGRWGSSFDAQRMIAFARDQGREDEMIEAIYTANHVKDLPLSDWSVLLDIAKEAGVEGAEEMLNSEDYVEKVKGQIKQFRRMGINSVPYIIINKTTAIPGAPEPEVLEKVFRTITEKGENALSALAA